MLVVMYVCSSSSMSWNVCEASNERLKGFSKWLKYDNPDG